MGPPRRRQPDDSEPCFSPDLPYLAESWLNRRLILPGGRAQRRKYRGGEPARKALTTVSLTDGHGAADLQDL
jgi:hypothetical protein